MKLYVAVEDHGAPTESCLIAADEKLSRLLLGVRLFCPQTVNVEIWEITILDDVLAKALMLQHTNKQRFSDGFAAVRNMFAAADNGQLAILSIERV